MGVKTYLRTVGVNGLLQLLKSKLTKSDPIYKTSRKECKFPFWVRLTTSDIPTCKQIFIYREYDFAVKESPKIIIDAGANIGLASIFFANKYPDAQILAIEPEKSNFDLLARNTAPYPNITAIQAALWHKNEQINLVDPGLGKWGFMTEQKGISAQQNNICHSVPAITVSKLMEDYNLEKIDILKIDIEGAEKEVFSDSSPWVNKVNSIIVELHESQKPGCNRSFYCGTNGFDTEWKQGENVYLSRNNYLSKQTDSN
ncbi:FkbM family methyltransferase [Marinifilum sp. JC120]|nr:FkbM family methyltransferase [Marinifilum sp. JC120]